MTRTIAMTAEELRRKSVIEQAEGKRITQKEGAKKLGISERYFRSLLSRHRQQGDAGLVSGQRGKPSNHRMKRLKRQEIVEFMDDPIFEGFGPTLMMEKLEELKGLHVSKETIRQIMIEEGMHYPKTKKKKIPHPQRERRYCRGELVQIDGSYHAWLEERGPQACLLLFVDDATSAVLAAEFVAHESFFAYAKLCKSYFQKVGIPLAFYSDKFSVFRVNLNTNAITQFNRAVSSLGIELICANSPQAKGRVERAHQTFQDRLVKELRIHHINTYQDANAYLPSFLHFYNHKFAVLPRSSGDVHASLDPTIDLDFLFSIHAHRIISKDLQIHFEHVTYQIITNRPPQYLVGRDVLLVQDPCGSISAYLNDQLLSLQILHQQPKQACIVSSKSPDPHSYSPPLNHPWRTYGKKLDGTPVLLVDP